MYFSSDKQPQTLFMARLSLVTMPVIEINALPKKTNDQKNLFGKFCESYKHSKQMQICWYGINSNKSFR